MGVSSKNSIAIENQGWAYELLLDKDGDDSKKSSDSKIFQRAISSLKFTGLFNN